MLCQSRIPLLLNPLYIKVTNNFDMKTINTKEQIVVSLLSYLLGAAFQLRGAVFESLVYKSYYGTPKPAKNFFLHRHKISPHSLPPLQKNLLTRLCATVDECHITNVSLIWGIL